MLQLRGTSPHRTVLAGLMLAALVGMTLGVAPPAADAAGDPAPALAATDDSSGTFSVVPGTHRCSNFGGTHSGYRAGHCADLDVINSGGTNLIRSQGQSFCQQTSGTIVQCAGLYQIVLVRNLSTGETAERTVRCGRYTTPQHSPACPSGRFQNLSWSIQVRCGHNYEAEVTTLADLPGSGVTVGFATQRSAQKRFVC
jgi:hypothetical protein